MSATVSPAPESSEAAVRQSGSASSTANPMNRSDVPQRTVATSSSPSLGTGQTPEGRRLIQRIALLLGERTSLSRVMLIVLTAALIFGLIGFAAHALWVVAVITIAIGLGYLAANTRRDAAMLSISGKRTSWTPRDAAETRNAVHRSAVGSCGVSGWSKSTSTLWDSLCCSVAG